MPKEKPRPMQVLSENLFPVVGVGASAGGIEAFKELVKAIVVNSGMAYVLIQHLSPEHESKLTDIIQKATTLPVVEIVDNIMVLPDHIYIIPSKKLLTANDGVLHLNPRTNAEKTNIIDLFFTSLAEIHQGHAIGVILSGTGNDGTIGLKTIKDQGGITIVQDELSAAFYGMPQSAIDADVVDFILSPENIPGHLLELARASKIIPSDFNASEEIKEEETFRQILALLRIKRGIDFSNYKQTTIRRRILRRKAIVKFETLKEYHSYLQKNNSESDALFKEILIPVTTFFRDANAFNLLSEKIFPDLFNKKLTTEPIRIWIAGCSSGEEAYSIAICLYELITDNPSSRKIQIFATDISETAIAKARSGVYSKKDIAGVSDNRIKLFFTKKDGNYHVNKVIREMCVFANQNFLKDPPFAKIDLVSCCNVLIYMEPYLQKKAFNTFHYALNNFGYLLLGKSESVGQKSEQFKPFSKQVKLFTKLIGASKYMHVNSEKSEVNFKRTDDLFKNPDGLADDYQKAADQALLSKFATVGVVVNDQFNIIQFRGLTGAFLEAQPGKASHNIFKMAKDGLSFELRNALHNARSTNKIVSKQHITVDKGSRMVSIEVIPLNNTIERYFLVLFEDHTTKETDSGLDRKTEDPELLPDRAQDRIGQLETELSQARDDMRAISEDQEAANEELQSANEELLSSSEELQTLNEELETTKEEIQSSNEELTILNQELLERNEQLIFARQYSESIVITIHEPLLVLTKSFLVKSANKAYYEKFNTTQQLTEGKSFFEIQDNIWDVRALREKLERILPEHYYFEDLEIILAGPLSDTILALNGRQLKNENSSEQLILLAMHDITEKKMLERSQQLFAHELEIKVTERTKDLKEANINLQYYNENLQQYAFVASHDLQEPLRKIKTFTAILNKQFSTNLNEDGKELIQKIKLSAERMSLLIKEVLEYSRVVHMKKEFQPTDLNVILNNVITDLDLLVSDTNAVINYAQPLPEIDAIPLQINQLFYNLLTNALKFHRENIQPVITISHKILEEAALKNITNRKADSPYIEIMFSDNGIGFEQQFADQIFQIFERLHSLDEYEGTGIGLALCKKIVENHNGSIYASSAENGGANFYVILPLRQ